MGYVRVQYGFKNPVFFLRVFWVGLREDYGALREILKIRVESH